MKECKDCQFRTVNCHSTCERYKAEVEERIAKKRYLKQQKGHAAVDFLVRSEERRRKNG